MDEIPPTRVLILEDVDDDAALIRHTLARGELDCTCAVASDEWSYRRALETGGDDLVLADYTLPSFDALRALEVRDALCPDVPVVVVSGSIGERRAAEVVLRGAADYVLKDELQRLPHVARRALDASSAKRAREEAEVAHRQVQEHLRLVTELAPDTVYLMRLEPETRIEFVSPSVYELVGYDPEELTTLSHDAFPPVLYPDDSERFQDALRRVDEPTSVEVRLLDRDGSVVWTEHRVRELHNEDGAIEKVVGFARDLTARRDLEAQLREAQKMEAVGRVAGGVAHDFNNVLTGILGFASLASVRLDDDPAQDDIAEIKIAAERASNLVSRLLTFSRKSTVEPVVLDLHGIVQATEKMLRQTIREDVALELSGTGGELPVRADPGQVEQLLLNLGLNAADAMPDGGDLVVTTGRTEITTATAELQPGRYATLRVEDTGVGMSDEVRAHLFEPFFTTKPVGKGTGLGLPTVYGIVHQAGGDIEVTSASGPRQHVHDPVAAGRRTVVTTDRRGRGGRSGQRLRAAPRGGGRGGGPGYERRVPAPPRLRGVEVNDGVEALEALSRGTVFDLVVSDVVMPRMGGVELRRQMAQRWPDVPALFVTGHADDAVLDATDETTRLLRKPFTPEQFAAEVRALLDAGVRELTA